jgi:hypothetical protein
VTDEEFAKQFPTMKWLLPHREPSPPKHSWSELPGNIGPSAVNAVTGLYEMVRHPVRTLQSLETVAGGAMNLMGADELNAYLADRGLAARRNPEDVAREEAAATTVGQALKDRYWGLDNIKKTMITDPVGSALDVLGIVGGGYGLVREGLSLGSKARLAEIPGPALDAERLAANELGPVAARNNIDGTSGNKSKNTIREAPSGASPPDEIQTVQSAQDKSANAFNPSGTPQGSLEPDYAKAIKGNEIAGTRNLSVSTVPPTGQFAGKMPKQNFLTKDLEKKRHNYPPDQMIAGDVSVPHRPSTGAVASDNILEHSQCAAQIQRHFQSARQAAAPLCSGLPQDSGS